MLKTKDEKEILKAVRAKGNITYKRTKIKITAGFSSKPCKLENNGATPLN